MTQRSDRAGEEPVGDPLLSVVEIVARARAGDTAAQDELLRRSYPALKRMAHGRLPLRVRGEKDTDDVVQITLIRAIRSLPGFEMRGEMAWFAYLRQILANYLRDEIRRVGRLPEHELFDETFPGDEPTPLDRLADQESLAAYERVLATLPPAPRAALVMRVEHGMRYPEIAERLGLLSSDAARMLVNRALARIGQERAR